VRLTSTDSSFVELRVLRYQFPAMTADGSGRDSDANWLVIGGHVAADRISWYFEDSCLMTTEAQELASWLRAAGTGAEVPKSPWTVEPNISLDIAGRNGPLVTVRFEFRQESAPPGSTDDVRFDTGYPVDITVQVDALADAAEVWRTELTQFPLR
jgi:hypothetical protein